MPQKLPFNGWLNLHKPLGITSAKAVYIVKKHFNPIKIGHAGTLDPLASGVLPLALGEATKTIQFCMDSTKEYKFTIKFGEATTTHDLEGEITDSCSIIPTKLQILNVIPNFIGEIQQSPPEYSAIKINGQRAYDLARKGKVINIPPRNIYIHNLELLDETDLQNSTATFLVSCGKGTYIRSLARDIAASIGTLGHVITLVRTKVGNFSINDAILLEDLEKTVYKGSFSGSLLPVDSVLDDIQVLEFTPEYATKIRQGQKILIENFTPSYVHSNSLFIAKCNGVPVAICKSGDGLIKPLRVFNF